MEFKLVHNIVKNIQDTIWNTGVESVKSLRSHTYDAKVKNFPKNQKINGIVSVSNQNRLEKELKTNGVTLKTILKWLKGFKLPKSIEVSNFPSPEKPLPFPKSFEVSNFPKHPVFPKSFEVSNQPTKEIQDIHNAIIGLDGTMKKMKLNPKITVTAPQSEKIIVPAPDVMVTQQEIDYKKLADSFPKPVAAKEIDYEKLADAIASKIVTVGGGGSSGGGNSFYDRSGRPARAMVDAEGRVVTSPDYFIADKGKIGDILYTGNENSEGAWYMMRLNGDEIRYASNNNNNNITYEAAWTNRASLNYDYPSKVEF